MFDPKMTIEEFCEFTGTPLNDLEEYFQEKTKESDGFSPEAAHGVYDPEDFDEDKTLEMSEDFDKYTDEDGWEEESEKPQSDVLRLASKIAAAYNL